VPGQTVSELERRYGRRGSTVLDLLRQAKRSRGRIEMADIDRIASSVELPRAHVNGAASFYADLGFGERRDRHVQVCDGTACFAARGGSDAQSVADELAADDGETSVQAVYCLGYCYW
jgi:bidirectional [NiFe] hydrogenase diaphorase subunit